MLTLTKIIEVENIHHISSDATWLRSVVKVHKLKDGEGALFINRRHNALRAVVRLGEPVLLIFSTKPDRQAGAFAATVSNLIWNVRVELSARVATALAERRWDLCVKTGRNL